MTSQVNPNNIDGTYPVAGQDNDSQGFRDNFTNIRNNLTYVKAEIEDIQNKAVLKSALSNTTLDNNFYGNIIASPSFSAWRETYNNIGAVSGTITIDFTNGNFQKITMSGSTTLAFSFPTNTVNQYASVKLWVSNPSASYTLTLPSSFSQSVTLGDPDTIAGLSGSVITFTAAEIANNTEYLFEFFTVDGGTTIGIKDLIRNRDVDLSGLNISGNLTLDNVTSSGNVLTTNGIFWAGNGQPFSIAGGGAGSFSTVTASSTIIGSGNIVAAATTTSTSKTTGALVVTGGAGVAGNLYIGGNVGFDGNTVALYDSILDLHTYGNLAAWAADDGKDIGIRMHYYKGADRLSALYMENNNETLVWMQNATETNSNITGTFGNVQFGSLLLANTTVSTSTTSGALQVLGGVGVGGALNVGSTVSLVAGSTTVAPLSFNTTSSALLTIPLQGAVEYDSTANVFYATPTSSTTSGRAIIPSQHAFVLHNNGNINLNGGGTIATINTGYGAFGNLNVTVAASTTYEVDIRIHVGFAAAPTSSTLQFTFGGTASVTGYNYDVTVINAASGSVSTSNSMSNWYGSAFGGTISFPSATLAVVSAAQTLSNVLLRVKGIIRTSAQGTLIPQLAWGTLPGQTAQCVRGSYIVLTPLGTTTGNVSVGNFTLV